MTQVEDSISQSVELNPEETLQLENFLKLLADLNIIEPPEAFSDIQKARIEDSSDVSSTIVCEAYLESQDPEITSVEFEDLKSEPSEPLEQPEPSVPPEQLEPDAIAAFEKLQSILFGSELADFKSSSTKIQEKLTKLEYQIYEPQQLINLLLPHVAELISLKTADSQEDIVQAIAPIVDRAIRSRAEQDKTSMGDALAEVVPVALSQQVAKDPEEVAIAIAPTMGRAMKKQIDIEKDAIVDALYPIIGNTISKYMAETIAAINQQVEQTLSFKGIQRKIRAKLQGVSEAELILKEALPFTVQAIFLIHKASGLVISEIQRSDAERLESDMLAGMLTAIRSFANDCINQSGSVSELDAIDYGTSKIILEVAGYCYLAVVLRGDSDKKFIWEMRLTLSKIVKHYGDPIEKYDGDPETVPTQVNTLLENLKDNYSQIEKEKNQTSALLILALTIFSAIFIPWGIWQYRSAIVRAAEDKTMLALSSTPELAVYRLTVEVHQGKLRLTGKVPNQLLRDRAVEIATASAPNWLIEDRIVPVEVPADPVLTAAEVKRVTAIFNQMDGIAISTEYIGGKVSVVGTIAQNAVAKKIENVFGQIPGVKSVLIALEVQKAQIEVRFYFEPDSATLVQTDLQNKLKQVKSFFSQHPKQRLKITGFSYSEAGTSKAERLAIARAKAVEQALINQGVNSAQLQVAAKTDLPPGVNTTQSEWLRRCAILSAF